MKDGTASHTARSVAARRLQYPRPPAGYGDPAADDALSRDVAGGLTPPHNRMHEYIRARTAFFDRVLLDALGRGVTQVVIGGAGYDGRALRYAAPGVRWFELDHPATQSDKRARLTRLGIGAPQVSFIPADFTADPVAEPLRAAGLDPARPSLFLFEGVAVYLEQAVNERVLAEFAAVAAPGSLLAISVSVGSATSPTRARFQQRVAALGEPARTVLTAEAATGLLAAAGWALAEVSGRQLAAGLLLARVASPADTERVRLTQQRPPGTQQRPAGSRSRRLCSRRLRSRRVLGRRPGQNGPSAPGHRPAGSRPAAVGPAVAGTGRVHHRGRQRGRAPGAAPHYPRRRAGGHRALAHLHADVGELPAPPARRRDYGRRAARSRAHRHQPGRHAPLALCHLHPCPAAR